MDLTVMQENRALALPQSRELTPSIWQMISQMAPVMWKSRLFGVSSAEAATAIMLKGFEMGMSITSSFEFIQVIEGKPTLSPRGALALILTSRDMAKPVIKELHDANGKYIGTSCTLTRGAFSYTSEFTLDDAKRAGLVKPNGAWEKYPKNMCLWRAIGFAADVVCPDIVGGMTAFLKMAEAYPEAVETYAVDTQYIAPEPEPVQVPVVKVTLTDLCNQYGAEQVMIANEGRIPGTDDEVAAVAVKLAGGN